MTARRMQVLWAAGVLAAGAAGAAERAPFVIPLDPAAGSVIALPGAPVGAGRARVTARDGHFWRGDARFRVWGVNLCFGACFPSHAEAEVMARRLEAAGVNSVRFHHMDTAAYPSGILAPESPLRLSAEACDRLDYFVDQLARRGIVANINLHVGRAASRALGMPDPGTSYDKIVGLFTPRLVEAQQQYARDLLGRTNRYRNLRYGADPAIAFVEVTNEDSFFMWDGEDRLRDLPPYYASILRARYAAWLRERYGTTPALAREWSRGAMPLGSNLLASADAGAWRLEQHAGCAATLTPRPGGFRVAVERADDTSWHLQLKQAALRVAAGQYYTVTFRARADRPRRMGYGVQQDHAPWALLGLQAGAALRPDWQLFRAAFTATAADTNARLGFAISGDGAGVELADMTLAPGGREGLRADESLEAGSVAIFAGGETARREQDRVRFLAETEKAYFDNMRHFIRHDLGVEALVTGTIVFGPCGLYAQSDMDYVDAHAYWQHPSFPGRPWDPADWRVEQKAMVDEPAGATLPRLAVQRLAGRPFTVSEYNHPAPSDYQAEGVPMVAAYAAAQDWDGVWLFAYAHHAYQPERQAFDSFFDIDMNPAKWGFVRAGAALFREGGLPPLARAVTADLTPRRLTVPEAAAQWQLRNGSDLMALAATAADVGWSSLLTTRFANTWAGDRLPAVPRQPEKTVLAWTTNEAASVFAARGRSAAVLVARRRGGGPVRANGIEVAEPAAASVTVTVMDDGRLGACGRILVAACGRCENEGMGFSADRRTVGREWGRGPVGIEPVTGSVEVDGLHWRGWVLASDGSRAAEVPLDAAGSNRMRLAMDPRHRTMWYWLER